jgi:hypothetical protein
MLYIVFVTSDGQSPLYETKSFNEGQIIEALSGQSPLYVTKSSDEGQFMMTQRGPGLPEDLHFHWFFGVSVEMLVMAWDMTENHSVLPPNPKFLHFLWALAFMRTCPTNNTALSSLLGRSNPKTISKYVWPFIRSIFALNECLVSRLLYHSPFFLTSDSI